MKKMPLNQCAGLITLICLAGILAGCSKTTPVPQPPNANPVAAITSLSVDTGYYGTKVVIKGTSFSTNIADDIVGFNGVAAVVTSATTNQIITTVPLAAGTGPVTITIAGVTSTGPTFNYKQSEVVTTFAGGLNPGSADGQGTAASFAQPFGITIDASGDFYISDQDGNRIRKMTFGGKVTTLAGSGSQGFADGTGAAATFSFPSGLTTDDAGNVYIADQGNNLIREITPAGDVTTFAGNRLHHSTDGQGTAASFSGPTAMTTDASGNLYVADKDDGAIRKITPAALVSTIASGLNNPTALTIDKNGNIYEVDLTTSVVQKITPAGAVSLVAGSSPGMLNGTGSGAKFNLPTGIAIDKDGNIYIADTKNYLIRKIAAGGIVTTYAGSGLQGKVDGAVATASFSDPLGVAVDAAGNVFVVDGNAIREITFQ